MKKKILNTASILMILAAGSACNQSSNGNGNSTDSTATDTEKATNAVKEGVEIVENDAPIFKTDVEKMGFSGKVKHVSFNQFQGAFIQDAGDAVSEYFFNESGNLVKDIHLEAGSKETSIYTYDAKKRLTDIEVKDEDGGKWSTHYTYQKKGENTVVTHKGLYSDNIIEEVYNKQGQITSKLDGDTKTTYTYNNLGKPLEVRGSSSTTFKYDSNGRLVREDNDGLISTYIYDSKGNLKEKREDAFEYNPETDETKKIAQGYKTYYRRNDNGKLNEMECDYGRYGKITTKYDSNEKISEIAIGDKTYKFVYASNGGLKRVVDNKGRATEFDDSKEVRIDINPIRTNIQTIEYYK